MDHSLYSRFRKYQYSTVIPLFLIVVDATLVIVGLRTAHQYTSWLDNTFFSTFELFSSNAVLCWLVAGLLVSLYQIENLGHHRKIIAYSAAAAAIYLGLMGLLMLLLPSLSFSSGLLLALALTTLPPLIAKIGMLRFYRFYRHQHPYQKKAIIIGDTRRGRELGRYFSKNRSLPQIFLGYFEDHPSEDLLLSDRYLGMTHQIKQYCLDHEVQEIYYVMHNNSELMEDLSSFAEHHFIYFGIVPDVGGLNNNRRIATQLHDDSRIPVISTRKDPLRLLVNAQVKRSFDVAFSLATLLFLVPFVFPLIALAIKLESRGPVFFKQLRPGRHNRLFWCFKFRTMVVNQESEHVQASKNDRRITRVGAFLRKTSLDELPQFVNVLMGDMSVVGPRPNLVVHLEEYGREIEEYSLRHQITPGITGYAQVSGFRGETKETYLMQKRVEHDLWYIEHWSLAFDLQIIGRTIWNVVAGEENAY